MVLLLTAPGEPSVTSHPIKLYEKGDRLLQTYQGNSQDLKQAKIIFTQLMEKFPDSPFGYLGMSRLYTIDAYMYGSHYNMSKIREQALPYAVRALELGPSMEETHDNYSVFELIFEQYADHQKETQERLSHSPDDPETYFMVADFIRDQGEFQKAIEYYEVALRMEPRDDLRLKLLQRIGLLYLNELDMPSKAAEFYEEAIKIREDMPVLYEQLGVAYLQMHQYQLSVEKLTKSLQYIRTILPEYHLMQAKGLWLEEQGKIQEAIEHLEKASTIKNPDEDLHYSLGSLYFKLAQYEDAFSHFKTVIDMMPQDPQAYYFAGRSAQSLGQSDLARGYYEKYLQFKTDGQEAEWIRANLPELSQK
jgi:tetratricopeptide (TPR) repeat protein